jgi:peptide/nickel transport system permease protein
MLRYIVRRLLAFIPTLFVLSLLIFLMIYLVPGDPVAMMLGSEATGEQIAEVRARLGLDRPFQERMLDWYTRVLRGDLGESYFLSQSVSEALVERFPITVSLSVLALMVAASLGILAGIVAGVRQGSWTDWTVMVMAMLGLSLPVFWLALNLIFLFSVKLGWFPTGGYVPLAKDPVEFVKHLALPGVTLGLVHAAVIARITRSSMVEVLRQEYIQAARAKGLRECTVIFRHAFRNALLPVITILGISTGELLAGSVITETVFNLPGVGRLIIDAVRRRDYPVVQGGILFITFSYLLVNLIVDLVYAWVNPRIRYS